MRTQTLPARESIILLPPNLNLVNYTRFNAMAPAGRDAGKNQSVH
jgi:hypothetical protein